jgi:hypothetical protein
MEDLITKIGGGLVALAGGWYAFVRMIKRDRRDEKVASLHDEAIEHVIKTLREEIARLSDRLAAVEEQNRKCEEMNDSLREEIIAMKKQLHLF